jgi:3-hydroxymyristoyl/3-hydroxydecanoyl-(acyl carrier protein) dehydratase
MLLNNLLCGINNLQYAEKDIIMAEININEQDAIFKGHFPGETHYAGILFINMLTDVLSESKKNRYLLSRLLIC